MVELKALKMIQAKNYKHLAFDIDIGESSKTGQVHSSTHKLYWVMPLQLCACVCVCVWRGCHSELESVQRREHWLGGVVYATQKERRAGTFQGRGRLKN